MCVQCDGRTECDALSRVVALFILSPRNTHSAPWRRAKISRRDAAAASRPITVAQGSAGGWFWNFSRLRKLPCTKGTGKLKVSWQLAQHQISCEAWETHASPSFGIIILPAPSTWENRISHFPSTVTEAFSLFEIKIEIRFTNRSLAFVCFHFKYVPGIILYGFL